jgi:hypothetical protein
MKRVNRRGHAFVLLSVATKFPGFRELETVPDSNPKPDLILEGILGHVQSSRQCPSLVVFHLSIYIYTYIKVGRFRELLGMPPHLFAL